MAEYDSSFQTLNQQIQQFSPRAALMLDQMCQAFGTQLAFYAAFVITCLHAQQDVAGSQRLEDITPADLRSFTFFECAKENPTALDQFSHLLDCYRSDQSATQQ